MTQSDQKLRWNDSTAWSAIAVAIILLPIGACGPPGDGPPLELDLGPKPDAGLEDGGYQTEPFAPSEPVVGEDIIASAENVGIIPGTFSVTATGSAEYTIPIDVPPAHGLATPAVSLRYDSRGSDGWLGIGWQLRTAHVIHRCSKAAALGIDGRNEAVRFSSTDALCLDGARLVGVQGPTVNGATQLRLLTDHRVRVVQRGTGLTTTFEMTNGDGVVHHFGGTTSTVIGSPMRVIRPTTPARAAYAWLEESSVDPRGNRVRYSYHIEDSPNHAVSWYPTEIRYGGTGLLDHTRRVGLEWELRDSPTTRYTGGLGVSSTHLLRQIRTYVGAPGTERVVASYALAYELSPGSRLPRLVSLTHCDAFESCKKPTTFEWSDSASYTEDHHLMDIGDPSQNWFNEEARSLGTMVLSSNLDDDPAQEIVTTGRQGINRYDFISWTQTGTNLTVQEDIIDEWTYLGRTAIAGVNFSNRSSDSLWIIDDGRGLLSEPNWRRYGAIGGSGAPGVEYFLDDYPMPCNTYFQRSGPIYVADFNADGRTDLLSSCRSLSDGSLPVGHDLRTQDASTPGVLTPRISGWQSLTAEQSQTLSPMDLDGDGSAELTFVEDGARVVRQPGFGDTVLHEGEGDHLYLDVNGDGLLDALIFGQGVLQIRLSTGNGLLPATSGTTTPPSPLLARDYNQANITAIRTADFNGDGWTDFILIPYHRLGATSWLHLSNGESFAVSPLNDFTCYPTISGIRFVNCRSTPLENDPDGSGFALSADPRANIVTDLDGDGAPEITRFPPSQVQPVFDGMHVLRFVNSRGDQVTRFRDGQRVLTLNYDDLYKADYAPVSPGAGNKQTHVGRGLRVVSSVRDADSVITEYSYRGGRVSLVGEGFLGFTSVTSSTTSPDYPEARQIVNEYDLGTRHTSGALAHAGFPVRTLRRQLGGEGDSFSSRTTMTEFSRITVDDPDPSVAFISVLRREVRSRSSVADDGDPEVTSDASISTYYPDDYGVPVLITTQVTEGTEASGSTRVQVEHRPENGFIGLVTSYSVTELDPNTERNVTREWAATYNDFGERDSVTYFPGKGYARVVEITQRHARGPAEIVDDMTAGHLRRTVREFDADGVFATYERNPEGHESYQASDPGTGATIAVVDANGAEWRTTIDGFGRAVQLRQRGEVINRVAYEALGGGGTRTTTSTSDMPSMAVETDHRGNHRLTAHTNATGEWVVSTGELRDDRGNVIGTCFDYMYGTTPTSCASVERDSDGRVTAQLDRSGTTSTRVYDASGDTVTEHYEQRQSRKVDRDMRGRVRRVEDGIGSDEASITVFSYGAFGQLASVRTDGWVLRGMTYRPDGALVEIVDADAGSQEFIFDGYGELSRVLSSGVFDVTFQRDGLGRVVVRTDAQGIMTYDYDMGPFARGRLHHAESESDDTEIEIDYDHRGRVVERRDSIVDRDYRTSYEFDGALLSQTSFPDHGGSRVRVRREYQRGHLVRLHDADSPTEFWRATERSLSGRVTSSLVAFAGIEVERDFNATTGLLDHQAVTGIGGPRSDTSFSYRTDGLLEGRDEAVTGRSERFGYDAIGRLELADLDGGYTAILDYDSLGNLDRISRAGRPERTIQYGERGNGPRTPTGDSTGRVLEYDSAGRRVLSGTTEIDYRSFDLPSRVWDPVSGTLSLYRYSPLLERVQDFGFGGAVDSVGGFTVSVAQGLATVGIEAPDGTLIRVESQASTGARRLTALTTDSTGTVQMVHRENNTSERRFMTVFGEPMDENGAPISPVLMGAEADTYGGHELDGGGIVNMRGRLLDATIGMFLSTDPAVPDPLTTVGSHPYVYAIGLPHLLRDRDGYNPLWYAASSNCLGGYCDVLPGTYIAGLGTGQADGSILPDPINTGHVPARAAVSTPGLRTDRASVAPNVYSSTRVQASNPDALPDFVYDLDDWLRQSGTADAVVGFGDGASFGVGRFLREAADPYDGRGGEIDYTSEAYQTGDEYGTALQTAIGLALLAQPLVVAYARGSVLGGGASAGVRAALGGGVAGSAGGGALPNVPWTYASLSGLGETTAQGEIFIQHGLTGETLRLTLRHEYVHRLLTPLSGPLLALRQNFGSWAYHNSHLLRFTEEFIAEAYATGSISAGYSLAVRYEVTALRILGEAGLYFGVTTGGVLWTADRLQYSGD